MGTKRSASGPLLFPNSDPLLCSPPKRPYTAAYPVVADTPPNPPQLDSSVDLSCSSEDGFISLTDPRLETRERDPTTGEDRTVYQCSWNGGGRLTTRVLRPGATFFYYPTTYAIHVVDPAHPDQPPQVLLLAADLAQIVPAGGNYVVAETNQ